MNNGTWFATVKVTPDRFASVIDVVITGVSTAVITVAITAPITIAGTFDISILIIQLTQ